MTTKRMSSKNKAILAKEAKQSESVRYAKLSLSASTMSAAISESFTKTIMPEAGLAEVADALRKKLRTFNRATCYQSKLC